MQKKNESPQTPRPQTIQAEINGAHWSAPVAGYEHTGIGDRVRIFSETKSDGSSMQVYMPENTTGVFDAVDGLGIVVYHDGTNQYFFNVSGTVTLLHNSANKVEGSFDLKNVCFFTNDTLDMTKGSFYWSK